MGDDDRPRSGLRDLASPEWAKTRQRGFVAIGDSMGARYEGARPCPILLVELLVPNVFSALPIRPAMTRFAPCTARRGGRTLEEAPDEPGGVDYVRQATRLPPVTLDRAFCIVAQTVTNPASMCNPPSLALY